MMESYIEQLEARIVELETELEHCECRAGSLRMLEEFIDAKHKWANFCKMSGEEACKLVLNYIKKVKEIKKLEKKHKKLKQGRWEIRDSSQADHDANMMKHNLGRMYRV